MWVFHPIAGNIVPTYMKIVYYFVSTIVNKYFKFQNDWMKIIHIRPAALKFVVCFVLKKSKNLIYSGNLLNDIHRNLINTSLYYDATKYKIS